MLPLGLPGRRGASVQHEFYCLDGVPLLSAHGRCLHAPDNCLASRNYVATKQVTLHTTSLQHCRFVTFSPWTTERMVKDVALAFAQMSGGIGVA